MSRRILLLLILAATLLVAAARLSALVLVEPRYDQAFFAWWVRSLVDAPHFWPHALPGDSLFEALKTDTGSVLHQLFRNIYNKPTSLLTLVPLAVVRAGAVLAGESYLTQTAISIMWACLLLPLLGSFGWWGRRAGAHPHGIALLALTLAAVNPVLFWFSPLGIHNFGIVGLVAAVAATEARLGARTRGEPPSCRRKTEIGLHLLALYSHWTTAFLLPASALATRWLAGGTWRQRWRLVLGYAPVPAILGLSLAPLLALEFFRPAEGQVHSLAAVTRMTNVAEAGQLAASMLAGARIWLGMAKDGLGPAGTLGALLGLGLLWRRGVRGPALVVLIHFALFLAMPGFSGAGLRLFPYALPFLCLGLAQLLIGLAGRGIRWRGAAALLLAVHLTGQIPPLLSSARAEAALPKMWAFYYRGQSELRPMIRDMDAAIGTDGVLLSWSYGTYCVHEALREGPPMAAVLDGLWLRHTQGSLDAYLARRPVIRGGRVFLVTEDWELAQQSPPLTEILPVVLGPKGLGLRVHPRLVPVAHWALTTSTPGDTTLWEVLEGEAD
ncbi:MAG: hypothetical protein HY055_09155 [Magnetospirillum sp.]|nr:hypothetical protein [Magnetospirillum sp.]